MKKDKAKLKIIAIAMVFQLIIYVVQYILLPVVYVPKPYDESSCYLVLGFSTFIIVFVGQMLFVKKVYGWICSFFIYPMLIVIYHPAEIYGIGYRQHSLINLVEFDIFLVTTFVLCIELVACILVSIVNHIRNIKK